MAYVETVGLIVSLFCLPLLGFLLGKRFTAARLTGEQDRQVELQDIHTLIDNNRNDVAVQVQSIYDEIKQHDDETHTLIENNRNDVGVQVQSIYDEIKQHADNNSREGNEVWNKLDEVWNRLQKVDKNLAGATPPLYQTTTTAPNDFI